MAKLNRNFVRTLIDAPLFDGILSIEVVDIRMHYRPRNFLESYFLARLEKHSGSPTVTLIARIEHAETGESLIEADHIVAIAGDTITLNDLRDSFTIKISYV